MTVYSKPHLSLADQLSLLKQRGLQITDDVAAMEYLHRNGYYRLSAYWYPFREIVANQRSDNFLPNSKFEDACALYIFDKNLKLLLLDAIECVEIAARAEIALHLGAYDIFAHTKPHLFRPSFTKPDQFGRTKYEKWQKNLTRQLHGHKMNLSSTMRINMEIVLQFLSGLQSNFGILGHFHIFTVE